MTTSKDLDLIYKAMVFLYFLSFLLPVGEIFKNKPLYGYHCAYMGILFYGLAIPAHVSAIGGIIHRFSMKHPENPNPNWTNISVILSIIGTLVWFLIIQKPFYIGYYIWTFSTISMAVVYKYFRIKLSEEQLLD